MEKSSRLSKYQNKSTDRIFVLFLDWPVALVVFACVGLVSILVLYLIVRVRSNNRQQHSLTNNGDDLHSQMEWEDDIGLNITVNPLDETKVCLISNCLLFFK